MARHALAEVLQQGPNFSQGTPRDPDGTCEHRYCALDGLFAPVEDQRAAAGLVKHEVAGHIELRLDTEFDWAKNLVGRTLEQNTRVVLAPKLVIAYQRET